MVFVRMNVANCSGSFSRTCARAEIVGRGDRVAECGGLENRWACKRPVGSNPTLSARFFLNQ